MAAAAAAAYTYLPVSTYCSYFPPARALHSLNQVNPPTQVNRSRSRELNRLLAPLTPSSLSHSLSLYSLHHHPIILFVVSFPGLSLSCPHIPNSYVHYYYQYFPHFPFICSNYLRISLLLRLNSFYLPSLTFFFFTS